MPLPRLLVLLCITACLAQGQTQPSATSSSAVTSPVKKAKTSNPKKTTPAPTPAAKPFLLEVYDLTRNLQPIDPGGCYPTNLKFPATNADQVAKALSFGKDYTFNLVGPDKIAIYNTSAQRNNQDLKQIEGLIDSLASSDFNSAIAVPVSRNSADKTLKQLNLSADASITAKAVGDRCILLLSKTRTPDPVALAALRKSLPGVYWHIESAQPTQRLFHLDATATVKTLGDASDSSKPSGDGDTSTAANSKAGSGTATKKTNGPAKPAITNPGNTLAQTIAVSVAAGSNSEADNPGTTDSPATDSPADSPSTPKPKTDAAPAAKPLTMKAVNDTLVYSNDDGSDKGIYAKNQLMAVLDLPRPEVLMNIWSLQVSTRSPQVASEQAQYANELISHHNDVLQDAIENGWDSLSRSMTNRYFFEPTFYNYVTRKFAETDSYVRALDPAEETADAKRKVEDNKTRIDQAIEEERSISGQRKRWGWCGPHQYCLGFIHAFEPVRPTLTNILLTLIAAKDSIKAANEMVDSIECPPKPTPYKSVCKDPTSEASVVDDPKLKRFRGCIQGALKDLQMLKQESPGKDCELHDRIVLLDQVSKQQSEERPEGLQLECFRQQAKQSFDATPDHAATRVGLLRAAVADFLFNYKWASQYPHDFVPYDLTQSAQELNAEFNPLVLAFNRDVKAFTDDLETELQCKHDANDPNFDAVAWFKHKGDETFLNNGMISVRGISGLESVVDTVTQSFFDATTPPSLTDLVKSVSDAEKNIPGVLQTNLTANEAAVLLGAINSVQPAEAKIGRELKLDITPHALAGASSAELEIKLTADEVSNPTLYKADKQTEDTISRVAKHDTNTRVRVESLKLFDVSAFSAELQRPRSKFPIILPFVEVPYFGSFVGWPLKGAKVYHRSTAVVSAIIVPTATDLAFGIEFGGDRICDVMPPSPLHCEYAKSPRDFGDLPLRNFHKAMVHCFGSGGRTLYPGLLTEELKRPDDCGKLSLVPDELLGHEKDGKPERLPGSADEQAVPPKN